MDLWSMIPFRNISIFWDVPNITISKLNWLVVDYFGNFPCSFLAGGTVINID